MTLTGMPAAASAAIAARRRSGAAARGSMLRASSRSSVVTDRATLTRPFSRHRREEIDVAHDERRFRHDADGMIGARQHLEQRAHDPVLAFDRLVGVGIGADRDRLRLVAGGGELAFEQGRCALFHEQPQLEIEPRRKPHIGVGRTGEAVGAAVLAAAIGVDRAVEGNVGQIVTGDDGLRPFERDFRLERLELFAGTPAVVELFARLALERPLSLVRAPAAAPLRRVEAFGDRRRLMARIDGRKGSCRVRGAGP